VADRNGIVYKITVDLDQRITGEDNFDRLPKDEKVKAAITWLNTRNNP
jgi:hypothetical protein